MPGILAIRKIFSSSSTSFLEALSMGIKEKPFFSLWMGILRVFRWCSYLSFKASSWLHILMGKAPYS